MSEQYVSMAEVRDLLKDLKEKRGVEEIPMTQDSAIAHAVGTCKISKEQADEIIGKVNELEFVKNATSNNIAYKVADILPKHPEDVRAIFYKERVPLEADDIQKILDIVAPYL